MPITYKSPGEGFDLLYNQEIVSALKRLGDKPLGERGGLGQRFAKLRTCFAPLLDDNYFSRGSMQARNFPPGPLSSLHRAVSAMMSFHQNPTDKFFILEDMNRSLLGEDPSVDLEKALDQRTEAIHTIYQDPVNLCVEAQMMKDKLIFGLGTKVLEESDRSFVRFAHYIPEETILWSSNGRVFDIFGVCEMLTYFQFMQRVPNPFTVTMAESLQRDDLAGEAKTKFVRLNIPKGVFINHLTAYFRPRMMQEMPDGKKMGSSELDNVHKDFVKRLPGNQESWLEIMYCDYGVGYIKARGQQNIITSYFRPPNGPQDVPRSPGEEALPTAVVLSEMRDINLSAYEKTGAPPWVLPSQTTTKGMDETGVQREGVIYAGPETPDVAKPLGLNAPLEAMLKFYGAYQAEFDRAIFLDLFELLKQTHMTKDEVATRRQDDIRQLGVFALTDEATNLVPTVMFINGIVGDRRRKLGNETPLEGTLLTAKYISAVAYSHRNTLFDRSDRLMQSIGRVSALKASSPSLEIQLNFMAHVKQLVLASGMKDFLNGEKRVKELQAIEEANRRVDLQLKVASAAGQEINNVRAAKAQEPPQMPNQNRRSPVQMEKVGSGMANRDRPPAPEIFKGPVNQVA